MNIALVYNVRHFKPSLENKKAQAEAEFDEPATIKGILRSLQKSGHKIINIEADEKAYLKLKKLKTKINLAFVMAEGLHGADREAQIPAMLEMLQIPYIGSKPLAQALCLNKAKAKEILAYHQIPTPLFQIFKNHLESLNKHLRFPLIVKPNSEGSSKGIKQCSVVKNKKELYRQIKDINQNLHQPALVEEFLTGREFTVAVIGNNPGKVLPVVEVDFSNLPKNLLPLDSYEVKWLIDNPNSDIETTICPAKIDKTLLSKIQDICLRTKKVLDILDWCRIDIRLDKKNNPHILEINQIPGIMPDPKENSRFPMAARAAGYNFEQMLQKIIAAACLRYHIKL